MPTLDPNETVVDGPSADIAGLDGMAIARDGTGGLVYRKNVLGVTHVFLSALQNGSFQPPVQVDAGMATPSSQPVIAAGLGGVLLVGFINNGSLYVAGRGSAGAALGPPGLLYTGAAHPSISMSNFGKAYLAFTATAGAGGGDVRTAYYYAGQWALESAPLDTNPADAAGTGTGSPQVAAAGDGTAIVVWGENGHVDTRRVVRTNPSVVFQQADVPTLDGWREVSTSDPVIGAGGDSSYASVAFQETVANGSARQSRVLLNRLHAGVYDGIVEGDGVGTGGPEGADQPQTAVNEYGDGWVTSQHDQSHQLFAAELGNNDSYAGTLRADSLPNGTAADAVPGIAGLISTFIAWQQNPGIAGPPEIRLRYAPNGSDLGAEQVISSPVYGAGNAAAGLVTGGDTAGDAAVAWVQGSGLSARIVGAQLYQAPGGFSPAASFQYARTPYPVLGWSPSSELWGGPTYAVKLDGTVIGQTTATGLAPPAALPDGRHSWQVTAVNNAGLATSDSAATVFVDTVAPGVSLRLTGTRVAGHPIHLRVTYRDLPPAGLPRSAASGVATVYVRWGDGSTPVRIRRTTGDHVYRRRRTYTVAVTATDRAQNRRTVRQRIKITLTRPRRTSGAKPRHIGRRAATRSAPAHGRAGGGARALNARRRSSSGAASDR